MVLNSFHTLSGMLTKYGKPNDHRQYFTAGSFEQWLSKGSTVKLLFEHKENIVVGEAISIVSVNDGLELEEGELFDTPAGRDMKRLIDADIVISLSLLYQYRLSMNPEPQFAGDWEMKLVDNIPEISLVISPGDPNAFIEGKQTRDTDLKAYHTRLDNFFKVRHKLECDNIREIVKKKWEEIFLAYEDRQQNGGSMRIN